MGKKRIEHLDKSLIELIDSMKNFDSISEQEKARLAKLLFERAQSLRKEHKEYDTSIELLKNALKLDPDFAEAHIELGHVLVESVSQLDEVHLFQEAHDQFKTGASLLAQQEKTLSPEDHWKWGICDFNFAKLSEEPIDFRNAVHKMRSAYEGGLRATGFLIDYGAALGELGILTGSKEVLLEAIQYIQASLEKSSDQPGAWLRLAVIYKALYTWSGEYAYFEKADHSYVAASRNLSENAFLWFSWGDLLIKEGVDTKDSQLVLEGLKHIEQALSLDPESTLIKARLADACMAFGMLEDDYEFLRDALALLEELEENPPEFPEFYSLYANCLIHLGRYFEDESYLRKAIDKIETGFKIHPNYEVLWHSLAVAHFGIGDINHDVSSFDLAAKFFSNAIRLSPRPIPEWYNECGVCYMKMAEIGPDPAPLHLAIDMLQKALQLIKNAGRQPNPEWVYNLGAAFDFLGEQTGEPRYYEHAISILSKLTEQFPDSQYVRYNLAVAYYHLGDTLGEIDALERAEEQFEILLANQQDCEEREYILDDYAMCLASLAELLIESGHGFLTAKKAYEKAEALLVESIRIGSQTANYYLACVYAATERYDEAMQFLERAKNYGVLPPQEVLLESSWFEEMKDFPPFKVFIATLNEEG